MQDRIAGHWQTALRRLHKKGWNDAAISEALTDLSDSAILFLEQSGWNRRNLALALVPLSGAIWTPRMVRHYRQSLGLPGHRPDPALILQRAREAHAREVQRACGWAWLLALSPPVVLAPRESEILGLLRDRGPLTRAVLADSLGLSSPRSLLSRRPSRWLWRLQSRGFILCSGRQGRRPLWTLAGLVADPYAGMRA